ncbi:MAG: hypothetical protein ACR2QO_27785 [Acidimicrobiales bacterium]
MEIDRSEVEIIGDSTVGAESPEPVEQPVARDRSWLPLAVLALVVAALVGLLTLSDGETQQASPEPDSFSGEDTGGGGPERSEASDRAGRLDAARAAQSVLGPLRAAELYAADPTADGLRALFEAVGGFEGLEVATAEGAFDLVRFDPLNPDMLLASNRRSYGDAANQDRNEAWLVDGEDVEQRLWRPSVSHDFVHFNVDGTMTMWTHGGGDGFAARTATILVEGAEVAPTTEPIYASRFAVAGRTVFALTGNGNYYTNEVEYVDLIAARDDETVVLADGSEFEWIDNPTPELLVAYPNSPDGSTAVWDAASLEPLTSHPLAGRNYQRVAVSGDERVALGVTPAGVLEIVDLETGRTADTFGQVDIEGVDDAITLDHDGTVAVTVERSGQVSIWWVGNDEPIAVAGASAWQPRWVSAAYGPMTASSVAEDASRVVLLFAARGQTEVSWVIVDTAIESWLRRACDLAAPSLRDSEVSALGLGERNHVCIGGLAGR